MNPSSPILAVTLTISQGKTLLAALPEAPAGLTYVCIGANCWGSAVKATAAAKRAREEGSKGEYILHLVNEGFEVDCVNGTLYYASQTPGVKVGIARFRQS